MLTASLTAVEDFPAALLAFLALDFTAQDFPLLDRTAVWSRRPARDSRQIILEVNMYERSSGTKEGGREKYRGVGESEVCLMWNAISSWFWGR